MCTENNVLELRWIGSKYLFNFSILTRYFKGIHRRRWRWRHHCWCFSPYALHLHQNDTIYVCYFVFMFIMCTFFHSFILSLFRLFDFLSILLARTFCFDVLCVCVCVHNVQRHSHKHKHCQCRAINAFESFVWSKIFSNYVERTNCAILDDSAGLPNIHNFTVRVSSIKVLCVQDNSFNLAGFGTEKRDVFIFCICRCVVAHFRVFFFTLFM